MKNKVTLYKIIVGFIIILFFYLLFNKVIPQYVSVWQTASSYRQAADDLENDQNWQEESVQLKRKINILKNKILQTNLELPESGLLSRPLHVLDSLARKNHLKITEIRIITTDSSKQFETVTVQLNTTGKFKNNSDFVKQVESAATLININGLKFKLESLYQSNVETELKLDLIFKRNGRQ